MANVNEFNSKESEPIDSLLVKRPLELKEPELPFNEVSEIESTTG